jgi:hypothetical protein
MDNRLIHILNVIGEKYKGSIQKGSRHYLEVSIGEHADLKENLKIRTP